MTTATFVLIDGPPVPKGRPRFAKNGHTYTPKRTQEYEDRIGWAWKQAHPGAPTTARVAVDIHVAEGPPHVGDLDNYVKVALDALNGIAWVDDIQVERITATITRRSTAPALSIEVVEVTAA